MPPTLRNITAGSTDGEGGCMAASGLPGLFVCRVRGKSHTYSSDGRCQSCARGDYTALCGVRCSLKENQKTPQEGKQRE